MGSAAVVASAITGLLSLAGVVWVARLSRAANAKTAEVQQEANALDGMDKLVKNLETRLGNVEERAEKLAERVQTLESERVRDKSLIRHLITYAQILREALRNLGQPVPEPPGGLDLDGPLT